MCSCPLDDLNVSVVPVSWSPWKQRSETTAGLDLRRRVANAATAAAAVQQVDPVVAASASTITATGSVGQLAHRGEQPSAEMDSVSTGRSLAAASLTVVLAWLVLRNLYSWHRNLPSVPVDKASVASSSSFGSPGRNRNRHGHGFSYSRHWLMTSVVAAAAASTPSSLANNNINNSADGWSSDYEADESETPSAADVDDTEPLFLPVAMLTLSPSDRDADVPLPTVATVILSLCSGSCQCCAVIEESPLDDDVSSMDCNLPSLSYDDVSDGHRTTVLTDEEPLLEQSPLVCDSLPFCYLDCNNNNDDDGDITVDSSSNESDSESKSEEEEEESYHTLSSTSVSGGGSLGCDGLCLSTCASSSSCCSFTSAGTDGLFPWDWPMPSITASRGWELSWAELCKECEKERVTIQINRSLFTPPRWRRYTATMRRMTMRVMRNACVCVCVF